MLATVVGDVLGVDTYTEKKSGQEVGRLDIYVDDSLVQCPCEANASYQKYSCVEVTGDLQYFDRRWYFRSCVIKPFRYDPVVLAAAAAEVEEPPKAADKRTK